MFKNTKYKRSFFYLLKILLFFVFAYFLYRQLEKSDVQLSNIKVTNWFSLFVATSLMPLNWFIEFLKWKLVLKNLKLDVDQKIVKNSFLSGIIAGMLTPNMQGNFLGRIYYYEKEHRLSLSYLTIISNFSQFICSVVGGALIILLYKSSVLDFKLSAYFFLLLIVILSILLYFQHELIFRKIGRFFSKWDGLKSFVSISLLLTFLSLSLLRYLIFGLQFYLMLNAFGIEFYPEVFLHIFEYYFWVTLAPSLFFGKFLVRDSIAVWVLGKSMAISSVLSASLSIWFLNLFIPTMIALVFIRKSSK